MTSHRNTGLLVARPKARPNLKDTRHLLVPRHDAAVVVSHAVEKYKLFRAGIQLFAVVFRNNSYYDAVHEDTASVCDMVRLLCGPWVVSLVVLWLHFCFQIVDFARRRCNLCLSLLILAFHSRLSVFDLFRPSRSVWKSPAS